MNHGLYDINRALLAISYRAEQSLHQLNSRTLTIEAVETGQTPTLEPTPREGEPTIISGMPNSTILEEATFNPRVRTYWLLSGAIGMTIIVITIPLIPFWFIFGRMITGKYLKHMGCVLTEKTLIVRKGIFNRIEKTIPLEKITDLALKQGPIMRKMELHALSIETAGSSGAGAGGALVSLVGINDTIGFRDRVLEQR
ncbi:MAG: PH domain-containing protein, partial [Phycisphaerae bacterium]|nr:PH domain-containing protein [Phycisphaerae bacterium]